MLKKILILVAMLYAAMAYAAVDVNKATAAELDGIKGIGPAISAKILEERKKGSFKDWTDFIDRVKGVGEGNAAKFSADGLTVGGAPYKGVASAPAKVAPAAPAAAAPAATAPAAKTEVKADAKVDAKAEAKAKKDAEKQAKEDAKKAKKEAAAAAPKAAASAAKK